MLFVDFFGKEDYAIMLCKPMMIVPVLNNRIHK